MSSRETSDPRARIVVIEERCKECELCVSICPRSVLVIGDSKNKKGYRYPQPTHPENCIRCRLCEYVCPELAVYISNIVF